jgi:hypothetical protein
MRGANPEHGVSALGKTQQVAGEEVNALYHIQLMLAEALDSIGYSSAEAGEISCHRVCFFQLLCDYSKVAELCLGLFQ